MFASPPDENEDQDETDEGNSTFHTTNIFGQSDSSSFKVRRDEKEVCVFSCPVYAVTVLHFLCLAKVSA